MQSFPSSTKRALRDVTRERVRAGILCLHLQRVAERLQEQVDNARAEGRATITMSVSQLEALARDVDEAAATEHDLHARLKTEELAYRQPELPLLG